MWHTINWYISIGIQYSWQSGVTINYWEQLSKIWSVKIVFLNDLNQLKSNINNMQQQILIKLLNSFNV